MTSIFDRLSPDDWALAFEVLGYRPSYEPDLVIAPGGEPYIYRWHLLRHRDKASIYFHIQVADDPERPLHDHPWDNTSIILAGGYTEILDKTPGETGSVVLCHRRAGDMISRKANWAHRLLLDPKFDYAMTIFACGPKVREWGFWGKKWVQYDACTYFDDQGQSAFDAEKFMRLSGGYDVGRDSASV